MAVSTWENIGIGIGATFFGLLFIFGLAVGINCILAGVDIGLYSQSFTFFSKAFTVGIGSGFSALSLAGILITPLIAKWLASSTRKSTKLTKKPLIHPENSKKALSAFDNSRSKEAIWGDLKRDDRPRVGKSNLQQQYRRIADPHEIDFTVKEPDLSPQPLSDPTSNQEAISQPLQLHRQPPQRAGLQRPQLPKRSLADLIRSPFRTVAEETVTFLRNERLFLASMMMITPNPRHIPPRLNASSTTTSLRALDPFSSSTLGSICSVLPTSRSTGIKTPSLLYTGVTAGQRTDGSQTEQHTTASGVRLPFYRTLSHTKAIVAGKTQEQGIARQNQVDIFAANAKVPSEVSSQSTPEDDTATISKKQSFRRQAFVSPDKKTGSPFIGRKNTRSALVSPTKENNAATNNPLRRMAFSTPERGVISQYYQRPFASEVKNDTNAKRNLIF